MENKASKVVTSDDSALHEPQEGKADDAKTQTPKRDYPEPSSSGRVGQPSSANKVETTGVTSNNDDKIKRAGEYMELVFNALGNNNFYEAEQLLKIVNHLDPHKNTQLWLSQVQQKNLADETLRNASESTPHSHIFGPTNSRMVGLGAHDRLRPAARVRFPVSLRDLTSLRVFTSDDFYVRGMVWRLWCNPGMLIRRDPTHLYVTITCWGPSEELRRGWRCTARGHVRVLQHELEGGWRFAFDCTFTNEKNMLGWREFMSWDAVRALTAAAPWRDVTDQFTLEVELEADPPEES